MRDKNASCKILNSPILVFCIEQILKKKNYDLKASPFMDWWKKSSKDQKEEIIIEACDLLEDSRQILINFGMENYNQ